MTEGQLKKLQIYSHEHSFYVFSNYAYSKIHLMYQKEFYIMQINTENDINIIRIRIPIMQDMNSDNFCNI